MHNCYKLALLFLPVLSFAQDIEPERPGETRQPSVIKSGAFQMETGFYYEHEDKSSQTIVYPEALLRFGLGNIAEFRVEIENNTERSVGEHGITYQTGIKPIAFGVKLKVSEESKAAPQTAVIISSTIPVLASREFQDKYPSPQVRFAMEHSLGEHVKLAYNLGGLFRDDDFSPTGLYTFSSDFKLSEKFDLYMEVYGFVPYHHKVTQYFDGGFMYKPVSDVMLDINAGLDLENHPGWYCSTGISFRLQR